MQRREFLAAAAGAASALGLGSLLADAPRKPTTCASPAEAMRGPRERILFVTCTYAETGVKKPDYLAVIDVDAESKTLGQVVGRLELPNVGDELHHFGWNACGSCHGQRERRYLIVPGLVSGRIHVIDAQDPRKLKLHKVIEPDEILRKAKLTGPHTVHCLPDGRIMLSMLGNEKGDGPGGFLLLDEKFEVAGRWEASLEGMKFNYDFWYQPGHNVMVSSEWAGLNTVRPGFKPDDVKAGKYGQRLHFWDWKTKKIAQSVDLGEKGLLPLEVRFHHDPKSTHGFVGCALSSTIWHWHKAGDKWQVDRIIEVEAVKPEGKGDPVPGGITDLVLSLDDRWLYFSNWLHGDLRQYDVRDPAKPKLTAQLWLGGLLGKADKWGDRVLPGGPQMLQLSLDGKRLYVTNSLFGSWDNQFYPDLAKQGSYLARIDCDTDKGGMKPAANLLVDFGKEPHGPARAHEMRFPGGDSTSDIWI